MKGKLICLFGLAIGGGLLGFILGGRRTQCPEQKKNDFNAELEELRQEEQQLLWRMDALSLKMKENHETMQELYSQIIELSGIDPRDINIQIDPD